MPKALVNPGPLPAVVEGASLDAEIVWLDARHRVTAIAKQRFARRGYEGTTLASVARLSGVAYGDLVRMFPHKLNLLTAVFEEGWVTLNLRFADIVITAINARDAMLSVLGVFTRILERDPDLARLLLFEGCRPHPESGEIKLSKGYRRFVELCTELAVRGQRDGSFTNACDPRLIAAIIIGAAEQLVRDRILAEQQDGGRPVSREDLAIAFDILLSRLRY